LDVIANMLLKSSAFIRSLNMHLYQSNINLKIDIPFAAFTLSIQVVSFLLFVILYANSTYSIRDVRNLHLRR